MTPPILPRTTEKYSWSAREVGQLMDQTVMVLHETGISLGEASRAFEKRFIEHVLQACRGNKCAAARKLGMHRNTLDRHIELHKIDYRQFVQGGRYDQRWRTKYASKERPAVGARAAGRTALAPSSADHGQREVNQPGTDLTSTPGGFTNSNGPQDRAVFADLGSSVRKGGRGESQSYHGAEKVATASTAHLAQSSKPPRGYISDDLEVECGGLKA